jgi:magnesium transporter
MTTGTGSGARACTVRTRAWRNGTLVKEDFPIEQVSDYLADSDCLVWADISHPDAATLETLADELSLDHHAVEDAIEFHERPKATRYSTHTFIATSALHLDDDCELHLSRLSAFVMKRGLVTVRLDDAFDMDEVVRRWDENRDLIRFGPKALVHGLLDVVVDGYFDAIGALDDQIEDVEDVLFDDAMAANRQVQRQTFTLRKALVRARRAVLPMREVVNTVSRGAAESAAELIPYYEDLYDHVLRAAEWTESLRDMVSSVFETNLSLSDIRMNTIMKKLTSWAAIIAVPTAITGYFGQNVPYPGFGDHWGFWLSTVAIFLIAFALYLTFRRKDWL